MKLQRLLSLTRQAVDEFHMIEEGNKIAVGISEEGQPDLTLCTELSAALLSETFYNRSDHGPSGVRRI